LGLKTRMGKHKMCGGEDVYIFKGRVYFCTKDYFVSTKHAINYKLKALGPVLLRLACCCCSCCGTSTWGLKTWKIITLAYSQT